jgi:hypothetical protein
MTRFSSLPRSARRLFAVAVVSATALVAVAAPATAGKGNGNTKPPSTTAPAPVASGTSIDLVPSVWTNPNTCAFDSNFTWSNLKGGGYNLSVKLYDTSGAVIANTPQVQNLPSGGKFTYIFTFKGAPGPQRGIYARGVVLSNGVEVAGTAATSPVTTTTCGSPIYVGWTQNIILS